VTLKGQTRNPNTLRAQYLENAWRQRLRSKGTPKSRTLNPAVFEILRSKRIGVTSLTFQGPVTSSVTWAFDSPHAISYWWSFGTSLLSV